MIFIFDLGFGQRGSILHAPVHRLKPLVDVSFVEKIDERARDHGLIRGAHSEVGIVPAAENPEANEVGPLAIDVFFGVFPALRANLGRRHRSLF